MTESPVTQAGRASLARLRRMLADTAAEYDSLDRLCVPVDTAVDVVVEWLIDEAITEYKRTTSGGES